MAIEIGGDKKANVHPQMNITPLIDVVLVLLIIFMVVTPLLTKQFWVQVPKQEEKTAQSDPDPANKPVVLSVARDGQIKINTEIVPKDQLKEKLRRVFAAHSSHTLFFTADEDAPYGAAVEAMDIARSGGAVTIAVLTEKPKS